MKLNSPIVHKAIAEGVGVFALVFTGCGSIMIAERFPGSISPAVIPVIFGLVIAAMIYALGHISGAHFNPAVTLAFAVARHFPLPQVLFYWIGQFVGGIVAIFLLFILLPDGVSYGATVPIVPDIIAVAWEIFLTFLLMFVIIAVATDTRAVGTMAGVAIGGAVALCSFVGGPLTGCSMNPARSLAPALFQQELGVMWIYFLGPIVGAIAAALLYEWIRCDTDDRTKGEGAGGCC